ncbi:MAG: MFS transporter, partial [Hungatella sp.]
LHIEIPETHKNSEDSKEDIALGDRISNPAFWYFFLIFGCYFVAEHGIMNWLLIYCREQLEMSTGKASIYLALFFGGITIGRLLLAPFVQKLGTLRSIGIFGSIGAVFYILAIVPSTEKTLFLLGFSGLFISIVYPTLVLAVQGFFQEKTVASVTGTIISAATVFDIGFNLIFGKMIDLVGFRMGFLILPVSILCFILIFRLFIKRIKPERYI